MVRFGRLGAEGLGSLVLGSDWCGIAGMARLGQARPGKVRQGSAGMARYGGFLWRKVRHGFAGHVWRGEVGHGPERCGEVRQARNVAVL